MCIKAFCLEEALPNYHYCSRCWMEDINKHAIMSNEMLLIA